MLKDTMKATGKVGLVLKDKDGKVKESRDITNLVVGTGLDFIASRMGGTSSAVMSHMGLGAGTTSPANGNTALESALGARQSLDSTTVTDNTITYVAGFAAGVGTGAVTEAGIFNDLTAGSMLCRVVFPVVNKAADDSMSITWTITLSAS
jgi:hypothetical protein